MNIKKQTNSTWERRKKNIGNIFWNLVLFLIILCFLIPVVWGFFLSVKTNQEVMPEPFKFPEVIHWENYVRAFTSVPYFTMIKNTLFIIIVALPLNIIFITMAGFAIGRMVLGNGRLQNIFLKYFVAGVILPGYVMLFPIYMISVKTGTYDSLWGVILPSITSGASLGVMLLSTAFKSIPRDLDDAAVIDGCGFYQMFLWVLIPVVKPAIATIAIINFLGIWNNFALARVLLNQEEVRVISLAAMYFKGEYSTDYALTMAGTMVLIFRRYAYFCFLEGIL